LKISKKWDFCYVDKISFIIELLENWRKANVLSRPRRFGRTGLLQN